MMAMLWYHGPPSVGGQTISPDGIICSSHNKICINPEGARRERNDREKEGESSSPFFSLNNPKTSKFSVATNWLNKSEELKKRKKDRY